MKHIYTSITLLLTCLLLTLPALAQTRPEYDRKYEEPEEFRSENYPPVTFYVRRGPWDSPFNPHDVIRYWRRSKMKRYNGFSVGESVNPKIFWIENYEGMDISTLPIPEGEFAASVRFIFSRTIPVELMGYQYRDINGKNITYYWSRRKLRYTLMEDKKDSDSLDELLKGPKFSI